MSLTASDAIIVPFPQTVSWVWPKNPRISIRILRLQGVKCRHPWKPRGLTGDRKSESIRDLDYGLFMSHVIFFPFGVCTDNPTIWCLSTEHNSERDCDCERETVRRSHPVAPPKPLSRWNEMACCRTSARRDSNLRSGLISKHAFFPP